MLDRIEFFKSDIEITSAIKHITDVGYEKHINLSLVIKYNSEEVKLGCTYTLDEDGKVELPIKLLWKSKDYKDSKRAYYDYELTDFFTTRISVMESMFENANTEIKRLYM